MVEGCQQFLREMAIPEDSQEVSSLVGLPDSRGGVQVLQVRSSIS